jgi:uncharacterized protein YbaA (DUF1428 family)
MPKYVDRFLLRLPKKNLATYRKIADVCGKLWVEVPVPFDGKRMIWGGFKTIVEE